MRIRLAVTFALTTLIWAAVADPAYASPTAPLPIGTSSLTQSAHQLIWKLQMRQAFAPKQLARHRLSICLVIEQGKGAAREHRLCVRGPLGKGKRARLTLYTSDGKHHVIKARVGRSSHTRLSARFLPAAANLKYKRLRWQVVSSYRPAGCRATIPAGKCEQVTTTHKRLLRVHVPKLVGCVARGPKWVFHGSPKRHVIAMTFDDGPGPTPPAMAFVNLLHRMHVPATFFEIGRQIPQYDPTGSIERRMLAYGDMIGNHTWDHPDMALLGAAAQRRELQSTSAAIKHATGFTPCLFRAPYGAVNSGLLNEARSLGYTTIQWDIDPRDWSTPGVGAIYSNVVDNAHNGAIVLQHFGGGNRYQTLSALPQEINTLRARGYRFVTVTQMLGYRLIYR